MFGSAHRRFIVASVAMLASCARTTSIGSADGGEPKNTLTLTGTVCTSAAQVVRGVFVVPLSAARGLAGWRIDSDGDGLANSDEPVPEAANDPDLDDDGFSDLFETRHAGFNPAIRDPRGCDPAMGCALQDADGDELTQVAEAVTLTSEALIDTDADGLPDGLEERAALDPSIANAGDTDGDGTPDAVELQLATDPLTSDDPQASPARLLLSWTLASETVSLRCYQLMLENLPMRATPGEASIFKIWLSVGPPSGPHDQDSWRVACAQALLDGDRRLPEDLNLAGLDDGRFFSPPQLSNVRDMRISCLVPEGWTLP